MDEHLYVQQVEDVLFLMDNGVLFEDACKRLGRTTAAVEQVFRRRKVPVPGRVSQLGETSTTASPATSLWRTE